MGNRIRGVVVSRDTGAELAERVHTGLAGADHAVGAEGVEGLPEAVSISERAERVKEYREKRRERAEGKAEITVGKASATGTGVKKEAAVMRKPYVVGVGGLEGESGRLGRAVGTGRSLERESGLGLGEGSGIGFYEDRSTALPIERGAEISVKEDEKPREIAFFSEPNFFSDPKKVKKKTQRSIVIFQLGVCGAVCGIMLFSKLAVPQLYENLHIYLTRFFGC